MRQVFTLIVPIKPTLLRPSEVKMAARTTRFCSKGHMRPYPSTEVEGEADESAHKLDTDEDDRSIPCPPDVLGHRSASESPQLDVLLEVSASTLDLMKLDRCL